MQKSSLKNKILKIIKGRKLICLATISHNKPWARFVMSHNVGLKLYVSSYSSSRKVKEIQKNPSVHALVSEDLSNIHTSYVQISGIAKLKKDAKTRRRFWFKYMENYYSGIDDPEYVVIEITPEYIEYWQSEFTQPLVFRP